MGTATISRSAANVGAPAATTTPRGLLLTGIRWQTYEALLTDLGYFFSARSRVTANQTAAWHFPAWIGVVSLNSFATTLAWTTALWQGIFGRGCEKGEVISRECAGHTKAFPVTDAPHL